jgi:hypothetical protein
MSGSLVFGAVGRALAAVLGEDATQERSWTRATFRNE